MVECKDDNSAFCPLLSVLSGCVFPVHSIRKDAEKPELGCWYPQREKGLSSHSKVLSYSTLTLVVHFSRVWAF